MFYFPLRAGKLSGLIAALLLLFPLCLKAATADNPPPVFLDPTPNDTIVDCYNDRPAPVQLRAQTVNGIVLVSPTDSLSDGASTICNGGVLFRIWEVSDSEGSSRTQQMIAFGAADEGPMFGPELESTTDTVECNFVDDPTNPLAYTTWLSSNTFRVINNSIPGCAPITSITNNGPSFLERPGCGDVIVVTYTVADDCGNSIQIDFTYVIVDNIAPVITGFGPDTVVNCQDPLPPLPEVIGTDCSGEFPVIYTAQDNQASDGSCNEYEYTIIRSWTSTDSCGNSSIENQVIQVVDDEQPTFVRPFNRDILCTQDFEDLSLTGEPTDLFDNCTPVDDLDVSYTDNIIFQPDCNFNFNVRRSWTVTDRCGNTNTQIQNIFVGDMLPPLFDGPADATVNCEDIFNFAVAGEPTNLFDNCTANPNTTFDDDVIPGPCANSYRIRRTWRIFDDCGNSRFFEQNLSVLDTAGAVFITPPSDLVTTCNNEQNQAQIFAAWVSSFAGAVAADACSPDDSLTYEIYVSGTTEEPLLPDFSCNAQDQTVRKLDVDVIVTDECGNRSTRTVQFRQVDTQPPNVFDCMPSQVMATDPGVCFANVAFTPPTIVDQCVTGLPTQHNSYDTVMVTSDAAPGNEGNVAVNPVELIFPINFELPINAFQPSELTITLENADAEGTEEYFFIIGEDGTVLGTTGSSDVQCSDVTTVVTLTRQQFNQWATDGMIVITLEPNVPAGQAGSFAINDLCPGGTRVLGYLFTPIRRLAPLDFEIIIDDAQAILVDPIDTLFANLEQGLHQITYRVRDCAGNTDECTFTVTVEDRTPPEVFCPEDVQVFLEADSCTATITVPLPVGAEDNCTVYDVQYLEAPLSTSERFLRFDFDANLGTFQANAVIADFPPIAPYTLDSAVITVFLQGDFTGTAGLLDVYTNDNDLIGTSPANLTDCDSGQASFKIKLAAITFNSLVADGEFGLRLQPREVSVPPGQPGDGVNPCGDNEVMQPGDIDNYSFAYVELAYNLLQPEYFTTGATVTDVQQTDQDNPQPVLTFNQGVTNFSYVIEDPSGNADTCTFAVEVIDAISPTVICQATTIFIDPSGLEPVTVDPQLINAGSTDNCGIDTFILSPATFTCDQIGTNAEVVLSATDMAGNVSNCTTLVSIDAQRPEPTANSGFCGGDSLFLFANPPTTAAPGQTIYTYAWFGPDNVQFSTQENPVIAGIDVDDEGPYRVVITGITGCSAEGIINVNIEELPVTPVISAPQSVCIGDPIPLSTTSDFTGNVQYFWYEGTPGSGQLLGSSPVPEFSVPGPHGNQGRDFYLEVTVNGCPSNPSTLKTVTTVTRPTVAVDNQTIIACENDFATFNAQPNANLIFQWNGPNGYSATGQQVTLGPLDGGFAGTYYLTGVLNEGCFSEPDSLALAVIPAAPQPALSSNGPVCLGEPLLLTASVTGGTEYVFTAPNGTQFTTDTATLVLPQTIAGYEGSWRVTANLGTCPSLASEPLMVVVNTPPVAGTQILPDPVCTGNDLILQGSSNTAGSTYNWTGPNGFSSASIAPVLESVTEAQSGDYVLTVTDPDGCRDLDTLNVDILQGVEVQDIVEVDPQCLSGGETISLMAVVSPVDDNNDYSYTWSGPGGITGNGAIFSIPDVTPANSGTYSVTVTNSIGCVSPVGTFIVDLQFAPATPLAPITADGEIGYCVGEDFTLSTTDYGPNTTYFWQLPDGSVLTTTTNSINLNAFEVEFSGNYRVRVVREGCTSPFSEPRSVIITDFPALTASAQTPVCEGEPIVLQATDLAGATYSWRGPNNFSSSLAMPVITTANASVHSGTYEVVATIGGCSSDTLSVEVVVQPKPGIPVGVPQPAICIDDVGAALLLRVNPNTATPGATYQWFTTNGTVPVTDPGQGDSLVLTDFGLFPDGGLVSFFVQADLNGCLSNLSNAMNVQLDIADGDAAQAGPDTTICEGIYLLQAEIPVVGNGTWELISGGGDIFIANPNSTTTAVSGMSEFGSPYVFSWALSNGECKDYSRDTVTINVTSGEAAIAGEDLLVCLQQEIRLNASPVVEMNSVGSWSQNLAQEILGVEIVDPTDPATHILGLQANNVYSFTWTVMSDCGVKTDVVLVNISDPTPDGGPDDIICNSDRSTVLAAAEPGIGSSGRWRALDDELNIEDPDSPTTMVSNLQVGDNVLIWEIDEGLCGSVGLDTVVITYKSPAAPEDDFIEVAFQGAVTFNPLDNDAFPEGSFVQIAEEVSQGILTALPGGDYTYQAPPNFVGEVVVVYLLLSDGCTTSSATITLAVGVDADCAAPNIFTPNNDGTNDFFVVPCLLDEGKFPNSEVTIYNQWGDEVFRSSRPYQGDFNGTYNGEELPVGTYFYHIDFGTDRPSASGHVRIQR